MLANPPVSILEKLFIEGQQKGQTVSDAFTAMYDVFLVPKR
jgi:hypothetical protein